MQATEIIAAALFISLLFYCLSGGADYGVGILYLLSGNKRRQSEREIIIKAIQPIWEANHVWLILAVVILFTAYPVAFSFISITLNIPLSLMLLGVVLRGSAFVFRRYDKPDRNSDIVFVTGSILTPILLGIVAGAIVSGRLKLSSSSGFWQNYMQTWLTPCDMGIGCFALVIFTFLAATYLTVDAIGVPSSQKYFRSWAIFSNCLVVVLAIVIFYCSRGAAPILCQTFCASMWAIPLALGFFMTAILVFVSLLFYRFKIARIAAAIEVGFILLALAVAQFPFLVPPNLSIYNCAANRTTLDLLIMALIAGAIVLFPSLYILFRLFK